MDPALFCSEARVMIVAGKGGVGKTTVSAALAGMAARAGLRTMIIEVEGKSGLPAMFGREESLSYHTTVMTEARTSTPGRPGSAEVTARTLTPDDALLEYLEDHGLKRISKRLSSTGTLEVVATAIPGIKDILVLGKVKQLERQSAAGQAGAPEFIVVDAPAAGHAITFLASAHGVLDAIGAGPIRGQASDVIELITDPTRCQVLLVTLPEETPVNEVVETAFHLEDRAGVHLSPVVVNGVYPHLDLAPDAAAVAAAAGADLSGPEAEALDHAAGFRRRRQELQDHQMGRLSEGLPLTQLQLPFLFTTEIGPEDLEVLVDALTAAVTALPTPA
jgi:anion-transporting  ArsA/GET3 family ATPase